VPRSSSCRSSGSSASSQRERLDGGTPIITANGQSQRDRSGPLRVDRYVIAPHTPQPSDEPPTFEEVYRRYERDVVRYLTLMLGDPDDAQDVAADVFGRALEAWRDGRGPAGRAMPWLLTIARRLVLNRWRRRRLIRWVPLSFGVGDVPAVASSTARTDFWLWLEALSRALPDRQREILILRYRRDLSDEEIGEVMGLTASGVRSLVARAVQSIRDHPDLLR
jgi:RNA polymerase sigma factor (sigma-70 family)